MGRLPPEFGVLAWIAALAGIAAFVAVLVTATPGPGRGDRGPVPVGFAINIDHLPEDAATLTRLAHDRPERGEVWHKLGLVLAREGLSEQARTAQESARDRMWQRLEAARPGDLADPWGYHMLGHIELALGEPVRAHQAFSEALRIHSGPRAQRDDAEQVGPGWSGWYNHACILSMAGHTDRALAVLQRMAEAGEIGPGRGVDRPFLERDRDIDPLRDRPGYRTLIETLIAAERDLAERAEQSLREELAEALGRTAEASTDPGTEDEGSD